MLDSKDKIIYVGKAKNLKNRVSSYFNKNKDVKTSQLVNQIKNIEVTITSNEHEALLLENQLIQKHKPRYNIIFKDDKSYPYLVLSVKDDFPQLSCQRGNLDKRNKNFGPYPSSKSVRDSLSILQKSFQLRQCDNSYFKSRSRPCLQYQIKRCSAPCVGKIDKESYQQDVRHTIFFLEGKTNVVIEECINRMDAAAQRQDYELAAKLRDQIVILRNLQKNQIVINPQQQQALDVLGVSQIGEVACIHMLTVRDGKVVGSRQFFPKLPADANHDESAIITAFIQQYYLSTNQNKNVPSQIIVPCEVENSNVIEDAFLQEFGKKTKVSYPQRGEKYELLQMAIESAQNAIAIKSKVNANYTNIFKFLANKLKLKKELTKIACFDVSHTSGKQALVACVVYNQFGALKSEYRKYSIADNNSDDYYSMKYGLSKACSKWIETPALLPDLLLIDGGKGQLNVAEQVIHEFDINQVQLLGIAKGEGRKEGLEKLYLDSSGNRLDIATDSRCFSFLLSIRDEAHRFAIDGHRRKRGKQSLQSYLETIPGVGIKRRRDMLRYFGGLQEVLNASVAELSKVPGINEILAGRIYDALHGKK